MGGERAKREVVDENELADSTVAILESQVFDSEAKTLVIDKMAQESTDHQAVGIPHF